MKNQNTNNANFVHAYDNKHFIDFYSSEMICENNKFRERRILESVCIQHYNNYNLNEGMFKLYPVMKTLIIKTCQQMFHS